MFSCEWPKERGDKMSQIIVCLQYTHHLIKIISVQSATQLCHQMAVLLQIQADYILSCHRAWKSVSIHSTVNGSYDQNLSNISCEVSYLDDGGDELLQEVVAQQGWPVMVDEVDQQSLNVGAILILSQS